METGIQEIPQGWKLDFFFLGCALVALCRGYLVLEQHQKFLHVPYDQDFQHLPVVGYLLSGVPMSNAEVSSYLLRLGQD